MNKFLRNILIISAVISVTPFFVNASISCAPRYSDDLVGKPVTFSVYNDEVGTFSYTWTGADGLVGSGESVSKTYDSTGTKNAQMIVDNLDDASTKPVNCSPVTIYTVDQITAPVSSCKPFEPSAVLGQEVTWNTEISGGMAPYSVSWTGSNGLSGSGLDISYAYNATGTQSASLVSVSSRYPELPTTSDVSCSKTIPVYGDEINNPNLADTGTTCSVSDSSMGIDLSVTWTANVSVSGGMAPYFISWSGTDGLSETGDSVIKSYSTSGRKTAKIISIDSADGNSLPVNIDCSNSVYVSNFNGGGNTSSVDNEATSTEVVATTTPETLTTPENTDDNTSTSTDSTATSTTENSNNTEAEVGSGPEINTNDTPDGNLGTNISGYDVFTGYLFTEDTNPGTYGVDVANLQKRLIEEGYYNGLVGGFFGAATEDALRAYQTANGLEVTGKLDIQTREKLNNITLGLVSTSTGTSSALIGTSSGLTGLLSAAVGTFSGGNWPNILYSLLVILAIGLIYWLFVMIKKSDENK